MSSINIKVRVGASYHRFEVLAESGFEALRARLAELAASTFGPGDGFAVTYLDDESDEIAMQSDEDLQTALQLAAAPTRAHMPLGGLLLKNILRHASLSSSARVA